MFQSTPSGGKATCSSQPRWWCKYGFNPRLPGGRRLGYDYVPRDLREFQSTPSGGKATARRGRRSSALRFQSTPSGGKATGALQGAAAVMASFNPRLPGGRRPVRGRSGMPARRFNPRLPGGRRRDDYVYAQPTGVVSIHAFRGEGDMASEPNIVFSASFNPRLPGGRRPARRRGYAAGRRFNPRLPGGRRPSATLGIRSRRIVSIHAFRGEGDADEMRAEIGVAVFQSTPSGGKATIPRSSFAA